jgi:hypothetical protein
MDLSQEVVQRETKNPNIPLIMQLNNPKVVEA